MHPVLANLLRQSFTKVTGIKPRSMQSNLKLSEEVIHNHLTTTVTADWLEIEQSSYAIKHMRKITRQIVAPPRIEAGIVCLISIVLGIWQVFRLLDDSQPQSWNVFLLILCVVLFFVASHICFVKASAYRLYVFIANVEKPLKILCETRADMDNLNDALLASMELNRINSEFWLEGQSAQKEAVW